MWPLKSIFFAFAFCAGCVMSLVNPIWGAVTYMMVYQVDPAVTWWGKPLMELGIR